MLQVTDQHTAIDYRIWLMYTFARSTRGMTCEPDYLIMGMSSETFWDGLEGKARAGAKVSMGRTLRKRRSSSMGPAA